MTPAALCLLANRRGVVFDFGNTRSHICLAVRKKLLALDSDILPHPSYSSVMVPSECYLFLFPKNSLCQIKTDSLNDIKNHFDKYFNSNFEILHYSFFVQNEINFWSNLINKNIRYIGYGRQVHNKRLRIHRDFSKTDWPIHIFIFRRHFVNIYEHTHQKKYKDFC